MVNIIFSLQRVWTKVIRRQSNQITDVFFTTQKKEVMIIRTLVVSTVLIFIITRLSKTFI